MKIPTWSIRGLNKLYKQKEFIKMMSRGKISIFAIVEHKIVENNAAHILREVLPSWMWCHHYDHTGRGRI